MHTAIKSYTQIININLVIKKKTTKKNKLLTIRFNWIHLLFLNASLLYSQENKLLHVFTHKMNHSNRPIIINNVLYLFIHSFSELALSSLGSQGSLESILEAGLTLDMSPLHRRTILYLTYIIKSFVICVSSLILTVWWWLWLKLHFHPLVSDSPSSVLL